jgi:CubicO group peptidase (beta-lactamase class C family)
MTINRAISWQRTAIWIAAVWLGLISVSAAAHETAAFPVATPESQGVSAAAVRRVAGEVEEYVRNGTIVGGELLIIKNRKTILHEVFGARDREDKRAMERDTIFNIRSMTKPLTGVAVQMLADEGRLRLDDPVAKYLPGFANDKSKAITIEQLLQHRSGLPLSIITVKIEQYSDLQAQAKAIGEKGPQFKPGEKFWYSDAGSDAAAAVVERISGTTIDRFVAERILQPLGMADSFYLSTEPDRLLFHAIAGPGQHDPVGDNDPGCAGPARGRQQSARRDETADRHISRELRAIQKHPVPGGIPLRETGPGYSQSTGLRAQGARQGRALAVRTHQRGRSVIQERQWGQGVGAGPAPIRNVI